MEELAKIKNSTLLPKADAASRKIDIQTRLDYAIAAAEQRIVDLKRAGEIIANNPELEELMDIVQRNTF